MMDLLFGYYVSPPLQLNFRSTTIEGGTSLIRLPQEYSFAPIAIGCTAPPRQSFKVYNGGDDTVSYEIDTSPLETMKEENYMMDVVQCLQPKGEIPPHQSIAIEFVFSPLEAKRYVVSLY